MAEEGTAPEGGEKQEGAKPEPYQPKADADVTAQADNPDAVKNALNAERRAAKEAQKRAEAAEARVREFEEASASDLEKANKRAEREQKRADEANAKLLRFEVAAEKKVPPELTPLLTGSTKEELESQATLLLDNLNTAQKSDFDGGVREPAPETKSPEQQHSETLLQVLGLERPR